MATTITISLTDEVAERLKSQAADSGQSLGDYAAQLVSNRVTLTYLDELLKPVREDFVRSGMSEAELLEAGRSALAEVRTEKRAKAS